ncbi:putative quinone oxidoreductase [Ilyonectria destructans]|nr:putative quinone oxidoreductase [Ilyonectria destructans]
MKEAIVNKEAKVEIKDVAVPKPGPDEVLIKVIVAGTNPKDWKVPIWLPTSNNTNTGDDIAGTVEAFGDNVFGFTKGDRVAAFHVMMTPHGAFAEYAIAPANTVFALPSAVSYEEAATIPLAAYTSAVALFHQLEFPSPWDPQAKRDSGKKRPVIIYGASTAIGAFAIKLAQVANIHPVIAVGSKNSKFVVPFLNSSKGDRIVDYTAYKTSEELVAALKDAVKEAGVEDGRAYDVYDCVSENGTYVTLSKAIAGPPDANGRKPRLTHVLPLDESMADPSVEFVRTMVDHVHKEQLFGTVWSAAFSRGLSEGWLTPHPYEAVKGGLAGLEGVLNGLKDGTVRGKKMVIRVGETEGVGQ